MIRASIVLTITYLGIAFTRLPGVNIDRPSAAFTGAVLMVLLGVLTFPQAVGAIDFNTIALLLGMMVLISALRQAGFFDLLARRSLSYAQTPTRLLVVVGVATGVFSAFLVNDVVVLLFTPVVIQACRRMRLNPVPFLLAEAMASNIGSTATVVGNPQNMLIGIRSGISFSRFFTHLAPIAALSLLVLIAVLWLFYRRQFQAWRAGTADPVLEAGARPDGRSLRTLVPLLVVTLILFFLSSFIGLQVPLIALGIAAAVLLLARVRPSEVIRGVDWVLLLFFAGLFIVIEGARQAGVLEFLLQRITLEPNLGGIFSVNVYSALISQVVSNVPLTILIIPLIQHVPSDMLWLSLAAGATLGGNATLIGAVSNIIVAEGAAREGVRLPFLEFLRVGLVVTALTVALAVGGLALQLWLGLVR
ncbi:MAG: anion transporter [Dehalococcoidia bacterium]|nr:anion transporter [Dehalococcoidia bacterium]